MEHLMSIQNTSVRCFCVGICWVSKAVTRFVKLTPMQSVEYLFHYDSVMDIPNHPDHHLQFEYDRKIRTPRFSLYKYEDIPTILEMIIRDEII